MLDVIVLGAGGHGQVVADILRAMENQGGGVRPVGFLDDDLSLGGKKIFNLPIVGTLSDLNADEVAVALGVGDNQARFRVGESMLRRGVQVVTAVHPRASVAPDVRLGRGVVVCAGVVVSTGTVVGDWALLNTSCSVDHHCDIGFAAHIAPGASLGGSVKVGRGALMGLGCSVNPGCSIGDGAVVGVGSAVVSDLAGNEVYQGVPARSRTQRVNSA